MNRFLQNIRRPEGFGGSVAAFLMNHKHATLSDWGISRLNLKEEKDILDIGCGGGRNLAALLERCRPSRAGGIDSSGVSVRRAMRKNRKYIEENRCRILRMPVSGLPIWGRKFDLATVFETVYFRPDMKDSFRRIYSSLRPGGSFMICSEADGTDVSKARWESQISGMRICRRDELEEILWSTGFMEVTVYRKPEKGWLCITAKRGIEQNKANRKYVGL